MRPNSNISFHSSIDKNLPKEYADFYATEKEYLQSAILPNALVCDIGCGDGRNIQDIFSITQNIVGVDYDFECIHHLETLYEHTGLQFICADAAALPLESERFDTVICMMSWLNFGDKKDLSLQEMKRIIKPSGSIILSVFSEDALPIRLQVYKDIGIKIKEIIGGKVIFDENFGANTSEQFTQQELLEYFERNQLQVISLQKRGIGYICTLKKI